MKQNTLKVAEERLLEKDRGRKEEGRRSRLVRVRAASDRCSKVSVKATFDRRSKVRVKDEAVKSEQG